MSISINNVNNVSDDDDRNGSGNDDDNRNGNGNDDDDDTRNGNVSDDDNRNGNGSGNDDDNRNGNVSDDDDTCFKFFISIVLIIDKIVSRDKGTSIRENETTLRADGLVVIIIISLEMIVFDVLFVLLDTTT